MHPEQHQLEKAALIYFAAGTDQSPLNLSQGLVKARTAQASLHPAVAQ